MGSFVQDKMGCFVYKLRCFEVRYFVHKTKVGYFVRDKIEYFVWGKTG